MLICLYGPLTLGYLSGNRLSDLMAIGALLGVAGASFAVALPLASRWYPPEKQGLAMDGPGDQLLAYAGFALNQHGNIRICRAAAELDHAGHGLR